MIKEYYPQIISTVILIGLYFTARFITKAIINRVSEVSENALRRKKLINRYFDALTTILCLLILFAIWGLKPENIYVALSSTFAIIGVAMFAQWSILSNITAGVILFFSFPFKIGDAIKIQDKDFPIEGEIEDIKTFHTLLITREGERISYPNNLLLQKGIVMINRHEYLKSKEISASESSDS
ncbi:mechanosensitive ion channel domain-containing protein [Flavobacterium sp. JP2137]|uniref:mechanosensitive ion channel domain-containing protein n=1 Tax=Flavobacterium sp. JP2137 TaxID=3414510 RepID=UPI003D3012E2